MAKPQSKKAGKATKTIQEREAVYQAEKAKREAGLKYEIDCMAVECIKWQIRAECGKVD